MDYSDFVYAKLDKVNFETCSFGYVEWRESNFLTTRFINCTFYNATISLCTFSKSIFDRPSSRHIQGNSKNYNVFLGCDLMIDVNDISFLRFNYGLESDSDVGHLYDNLKDAEHFLKLSVLKYSRSLDCLTFIESASALMKIIISTEEKNRLQKLKYLNLICKTAADSELLSVFGIHYLIGLLNNCAREINDSSLFMELVDLIMYLKTVQYKAIVLIEEEAINISSSINNEPVQIHFRLDNTYPKPEVENFISRMKYFLDMPSSEIELISFKNGSTIVDLIVNTSSALAGAFAFINFSLAQLNKTLVHIAKIKKTMKTLREPVKPVRSRTAISKKTALPIEIMSNEGNPYYSKMNDLVKTYGREVAKMDGPGEITIKPS
jgi:hypothetical protein